MLAQSYEMLVVLRHPTSILLSYKGASRWRGNRPFAGVIFKILLGFGGSFLINFVKVGK